MKQKVSFKSWRAKQATFISKQPNLTLLSELWIIDPVELGAREPRLGFFIFHAKNSNIWRLWIAKYYSCPGFQC